MLLLHNAQDSPHGAISKIGDAPLFDGNVNEILLTKGTLLHAR